MSKKVMMNISVHPEKVLIKITQSEWNNLFSVWVTRHNGERVQLFTDVEEKAGYERRFKQNVSVGTVVAVGSKVSGILKGDIAIIDYLVTAQDDSLVGYQNGNRMVAIKAETTYHDSDSAPMFNMRKTYKKGDYDFLSPLIGVVRMGKIKAFSPYVFLKYQSNEKIMVGEGGLVREVEEGLCEREIIGADTKSGYADGQKVLVHEMDLFSRHIDKKEISVVFENDIKMVL